MGYADPPVLPSGRQLLGGRDWWLPAWLGRLLPRINLLAETGASAQLKAHPLSRLILSGASRGRCQVLATRSIGMLRPQAKHLVVWPRLIT